MRMKRMAWIGEQGLTNFDYAYANGVIVFVEGPDMLVGGWWNQEICYFRK